jgi:hypothetical protein
MIGCQNSFAVDDEEEKTEIHEHNATAWISCWRKGLFK